MVCGKCNLFYIPSLLSLQCQKAEQLSRNILEDIKSTFLLRNFFQLSSLIDYVVQHKIDF